MGHSQCKNSRSESRSGTIYVIKFCKFGSEADKIYFEVGSTTPFKTYPFYYKNIIKSYLFIVPHSFLSEKVNYVHFTSNNYALLLVISF